jgi:hypothetical protein
MIMKTVFETEPCSRCGGTGRFSFCERFRDVCFRCGGNCVTLTKRGSVARKFFVDSCSRKASEIISGDRIQLNGIRNVVSVSKYIQKYKSLGDTDWRQAEMILIVTKNLSSGMAMDAMVRVYSSDDQVRIESALAYQATLTKSGTVMKRKKVA